MVVPKDQDAGGGSGSGVGWSCPPQGEDPGLPGLPEPHPAEASVDDHSPSPGPVDGSQVLSGLGPPEGVPSTPSGLRRRLGDPCGNRGVPDAPSGSSSSSASRDQPSRFLVVDVTHGGRTEWCSPILERIGRSHSVQAFKGCHICIRCGSLASISYRKSGLYLPCTGKARSAKTLDNLSRFERRKLPYGWAQWPDELATLQR